MFRRTVIVVIVDVCLVFAYAILKAIHHQCHLQYHLTHPLRAQLEPALLISLCIVSTCHLQSDFNVWKPLSHFLHPQHPQFHVAMNHPLHKIQQLHDQDHRQLESCPVDHDI